MDTGTTVEAIWSERSSLVWSPFRISSDPLSLPAGPGSSTNTTSHTPSAPSTPFLDFDALQVALTRLDHSPQKVKGAVGRSGALGSRRPPSRGSRRSSAESVSSLHFEDDKEEEGEQERKDQHQHLNKDDLVIPRVVDVDVQSLSKDHSNKDYFSERNSELLSERSFVSDTRKSAYTRKAPSPSDNNRLRSLTNKLYSCGDHLNSSREKLHSSGDKLSNTGTRLNSSRESVPSPLLSRLFRESGTTFEKNKDNVNVPGNNKNNKKKLNCITQIYQPLVLQSEVVSLSSFSGLESASQVERRDSRSSSEADVVISDRESIADSGVINRRTVIRINEKKSKSASSLVSKEEEEDVEPLWIRDLNSRRSLREEKKGVQRIIPIEIYPEVHGGINVSIVSQPDPYRKDSTSRMFVRQCDSENRPTRASAFNVRKTIEKRQIQQERRERKALREQLRQQLRSLSEGRQRKDSSSGSYVSSVLLSQNSLRSKSMSSLDQDTDDSRSESPLFKVQSSPTLEKEKEGIRTYLFGTNLTSDSEPTSHDILPPPRGVSAPRIDREGKTSQEQPREEVQEEKRGPKLPPEDQQQQRGWSQSLDSIVPAHERIIEAVKASRRSVSKSVDSVQRPERKKRRSKLLSQKLSIEQSTLESKNEIEPPSSVPSTIETLSTQSSSIGPLSSEHYLESPRDNSVIVAPTRENKTSSQRETVSPQREDLSRRDPSPPRRRSKSTVSRSTGHLTHEEEEDQPSWIRLAKERRSLRSPRPVEQVSDRASTASREPEWVTRARKRLESMNVCLTSTTDYNSVSSNITESSSAWSRGGLDALEDLREESYRIGEELTEQAAAKVDENLNLPKNTNMLEYHSDKTRDPSSERPRVSFDPSAKPSEVVAPPRRSRSKKPQKDEIRFGDLKHDWGGVQNAPVKNGNSKPREMRFGEVTVQETTEKQIATTKVREMRFGDNPSPPPTETTKKEPPPPPKTVNGGKKPAMRFGDSPLNLFPEQAPTPRSSSKFESIPGPDPTTMTAEQLNQNVEEYDFPIPTGKEDATELMKFLEESIRKREAIPEVIMKPDDVPKPKSILKRRSVENVMLETKESGDWPQKVEHRKSASFDWDSVGKRDEPTVQEEVRQSSTTSTRSSSSSTSSSSSSSSTLRQYSSSHNSSINDMTHTSDVANGSFFNIKLRHVQPNRPSNAQPPSNPVQPLRRKSGSLPERGIDFRAAFNAFSQSSSNSHTHTTTRRGQPSRGHSITNGGGSQGSSSASSQESLSDVPATRTCPSSTGGDTHVSRMTQAFMQRRSFPGDESDGEPTADTEEEVLMERVTTTLHVSALRASRAPTIKTETTWGSCRTGKGCTAPKPQNSGYPLEKESESDSCDETVPSKTTGSEAKEQTSEIKESEANVTNIIKMQRLKFSEESSPKDSSSLPPSPSPSFNASLPILKVETQTCFPSTSVADDIQQSDREDDNITHETPRDSSETPDLEVTQTREANQVSAAAAGATSNVFIANNTEPTSTITITTTTTTDIQTPLISSPMLHCLAYSSPNHLNPVKATVLGPASDKDSQAFASEPDGIPEGDSSAAFVTSCAMDVPEATKSSPKLFTFTFNVDQHSPPETSLTNLTEEEYINQKNHKQKKSHGKGNLTTFTLTTNPDDVKLENKERIIKITKDSDHSDPDTDGSASETPLKEDEEVSRKTSDGFFSTLMSEKEVEARKQSSNVEARKDSTTSSAENFREVTVEIADKDNNRNDSKEQKVKRNSLIEWEAIQRQRLEEDEKNRLNKNFSMKPVSTKIKELVKMHGSFITRQLSKDKKVEERGFNGHTEIPNSNVSHSEAKNIPSSEEITSPYIVKKMLAPLKSWSHLDCSDLSKFERIDDYSDMRNSSASARSKGPKKSQSDIFNVTGDDIQKSDVVNVASHPTRRSGVIHWTSPLSLNAKEDPAVTPERKASLPLHTQANGLNPSESSSSLSKAGDSPKTLSLRSKFANWTSRMSRTSDPSPVILESTGKEEPPPAFERKEEKRSSIKDPKSRKEWLDKMLNTISPDHITLIDRLDEERRRSLESPIATTKSPESHVFPSNEHCLSNGTAAESTTSVVEDTLMFKRTSSLRDDERVSKSSQRSCLRRSSGPSDNRPEYHDKYDRIDSKDTSRDVSKSGTPASSINDISQWERDMRGPVSLSSILSDSRPGSRSSSRLGSRSSSPMTTPRATPERVIPKELAKVGSKLQLISENSLDTKTKKSSDQKENIAPTQTDSLKPTSQMKSTMSVETSQFSPSPSRSSFRSRLHSRESTPPREREKPKEESGSSWRPSSYKPFNFGKPLLTMKTMTSGADSKKASMLKSPLFQNSPSSRARQIEKAHTSPEASSPKPFVFSDIQDSTEEPKTKTFNFEPFSMRYARERGPLRSQTTPDRESTPDRDRPVSLSSILSRDDSSRRSSDAYQFKPSLSFSEELSDITHKYQNDMGDSSLSQEQKTDDPSSRKLSNMSVGENEVFGEEEKDKEKQEKPQKKPVKEKTNERTRLTSDNRGGSPLRPPPPKKQNSAPPCRKCSRESHKGSTPPRTLRGESPTNSRKESCSTKGPSGKPVTRRGSTKRSRLDDKLAVTTVVKKERINSENDDPVVKSETVVHDPDGQGWVKTKTTVRKTRLGDGTTEKMTKVVRTDSGRSDRSFKTNASRQLEAWAAGAGAEGKLVKKEGQRFRSETEEEVVGGQKVTKTKGRRVIRRGSRRFSGGGELLSETKEMSSAGKSDNKSKGTKNSSSRKPEEVDRTIQTITTTEDDGLNRKMKSSTDGERYMTQSVLTRDGRHTFTTEGVDNKTTNSVEVIGGAAWAGERQVRGKTGQRVVVQRSHGADGRAATLVTKAVTKSTYIVTKTKRKAPVVV